MANNKKVVVVGGNRGNRGGTTLLLLGGLLIGGGLLYYFFFGGREAPPPPIPGETPEEYAQRVYEHYLKDLQSRTGDQWREAEEEFIVRASGVVDVDEIKRIYKEVREKAIGWYVVQCLICDETFGAHSLEEAEAARLEHAKANHPLPTKEELLTTYDRWVPYNTLLIIHMLWEEMPESQREELAALAWRRRYYLELRSQGVYWYPVAEEYWQRTEGISNIDRLRAIYMEMLATGPPPPTPREWPIEEQLASCWSYISGCGTRADNKVVWAYRNGGWLMYDFWDPIGSNLMTFTSGDVAYLYLTQACTLTYGGRSWSLVPGWNDFVW